MNTIYAYTDDDRQHFGRYKVGETSRTAEVRVEEQDTTAQALPLRIVKTWEVPDHITDEKIHTELERMGILRSRIDKDREWFNLNDIKYVDIAINSLLHGIARSNNFSMRAEQQECHDQFVNLFTNTNSKRVLLNGKPRMGKTFTTYQIIKSMNFNRVLVLTYKPAVDAEWRKDMENHIDFNGWKYLSAKEDFDSKNPITMTGNGIEILFASFQDLTDFDKKKWEIAKNYDYDLLVLDEYHYGTQTSNSQKILKSLKYKFNLCASGTPLKALISGEFLEEEIYNFGYIEEQELKNQEKDNGWKTEYYRWLPNMRIFTYDVCEQARKLVEAYTKDEGFSLTKMLMTDENGNFLDDGAVEFFIDQLMGRLVMNKKDMPWYYLQKINHMLIYLPPRVASAAAFCKLLEKKVGNIFKIINSAGSGEEITDNINDVKETIARNPKTITVSCGRFNTGVTVPEWDSVIMLDDGRSTENYIQTIFRCQTPHVQRQKENCYVFDFNPQRCLEMIYNHCEIVAKSGSSTQGTVKKFLDFAPILQHTDSKIIEIKVDDVLNVVSQIGNYTERFGSNWMVNFSKIDLVADIFDGIEPTKNIKIKKTVADNDLEATKTFDQSGGITSSGTIDIQALQEKLLRERIITVLRYLPTYIVAESDNVKIENINDIINTNNVKLFKDVTGIDVIDFATMCNSGFLNKDRMNRCIMSLNQLMNVE